MEKLMVYFDKFQSLALEHLDDVLYGETLESLRLPRLSYLVNRFPCDVLREVQVCEFVGLYVVLLGQLQPELLKVRSDRLPVDVQQ